MVNKKIGSKMDPVSGQVNNRQSWSTYKAAFGLDDQDIANMEYKEKMNGYITPEFSDTDIMNYMYEQTNNNNARMMQFNASEAEKARNWQEQMSNTSHQREVADLKAAGLNPVLSANSGAAAYSATGASASTHDDAAPLAALHGTRITNANQLKMTKLTNKTNKEITAMNNGIALQQAKYGYQSALATAGATKYAANANLAAAGLAASAQQYAADMSYKGVKYQTKHSKTGNIWGVGSSYVNDFADWFGSTDLGKGIKSKLANLFGLGSK